MYSFRLFSQSNIRLCYSDVFHIKRFCLAFNLETREEKKTITAEICFVTSTSFEIRSDDSANVSLSLWNPSLFIIMTHDCEYLWCFYSENQRLRTVRCSLFIDLCQMINVYFASHANQHSIKSRWNKKNMHIYM